MFALDAGGHFVVVARDNGWDLVIDDETVFYCRQLTDALAYMAEELGQEAVADGVHEVVKALRRIEEAVSKAADVVNFHKLTTTVARVLKHDDLRGASLELSGCQTVEEFKTLPECRQIVAQARAILSARGGQTNVRH